MMDISQSIREPYTNMCQYKTQCCQCTDIVRRVRSLLVELEVLRRNDLEGMCKFCMRANVSGSCKRCEYIMIKSGMSKAFSVEHHRYKRFVTWLSKLKQFLQDLSEERDICCRKIYKSCSRYELARLLQELKSPLSTREPEIISFPPQVSSSISIFGNMLVSKDLLEDILLKTQCCTKDNIGMKEKFENLSQNKISSVSKYFAQRGLQDVKANEKKTDSQSFDKQNSSKCSKNIQGKESVQKEQKSALSKTIYKSYMKHTSEEKMFLNKNEYKATSAIDSYIQAKSIESTKHISKIIDTKGKSKGMNAKIKQKMLLPEYTKKIKEKEVDLTKVHAFDQLMQKEVVQLVEAESESVLDCHDGQIVLSKEMIKGTDIVHLDQNCNTVADSSCVKPILFHVNHKTMPDIHEQEKLNEVLPMIAKSPTITMEDFGFIHYRLSDKKFIDKGWTKLPTISVMRKVSYTQLSHSVIYIYKMIPSSCNNWFERHKEKFVFYPTGEKFAENYDNSNGRWFYKNGSVALDYFKDHSENNSKQWCVVYNNEKAYKNKNSRNCTILGCFDYFGNGVVYDRSGNERIKYNQSEGLIVDETIGFPSKWKWHSLNDPPVLKTVMVDNYTNKRLFVLKELNDDHEGHSVSAKSQDNDMRTTIEMQNNVKEQYFKMKKKFEPFKIKMKSLKINENFSFRIVDQSHIYIIYRNGQTSAKLNIGLTLISNQIIDTDTSNVMKVETPYDAYPPKSKSIDNIQAMLSATRKACRTKNFNSSANKVKQTKC